nr:cupin domain-containing protein [uncultured Rhodoferax sp.]
MNIDEPLQLLGGLAPKLFMQRHWQKKPLVIRQAIPGFIPPLDRADLLDLAAQEEVQSRLVVQATEGGKQPWKFKHGPFGRKALPPFKQAGWTLLVQGVDLLDERVHALMNQFRFVPDARLDDVMVSYATDGGGVGPHFDSYDVFLLQAHGQRRWRIGRQKDLSLQPDMPLKILAHFEPEMEFVLNPGDMLYLPPRYAHDGIALGECMTYSIGFRAPSRGELAGELLQRLAEDATDAVGEGLYADPKQPATAQCGEIPDALVAFARKALEDALQDPLALQRVLGEYLTEPKGHVSFDAEASGEMAAGLVLDRRTRMAYDAKHVFINGESFLATGRDAQLMQLLANDRTLSAVSVKRLSAPARELVQDWLEAGWVHGDN